MNRFGVALLVLLSGIVLSAPPAVGKEARLKPVPWSKVERELKKEGLSKKFVKALRKNFRIDHREKVLSLNVLSFLGTPNHNDLVTDEAVEKTRKFLEMQRGDLERAEKKFGVPAKVIAALLWIETRHGSLTGTFHVPSVYLTLYLSKDGSARQYLKSAALKHPNRSIAGSPQGALTREEIEEKIKVRTEKKSEWALGQLKVLDRLFRKSGGSKIKTLKGSFAGAFGIPQFIPESFQRWAVATNPKRFPDLYRFDDAVFSVANYLKLNGWGNTREDQMKALMHYNNSQDYAEAILELATKANLPASEEVASSS